MTTPKGGGFLRYNKNGMKLLADLFLDGSHDFARLLNDKPEMIKVWKRLIGHFIRLNTTLLRKTSILTNAQRVKLFKLYNRINFKHAKDYSGEVDYHADKLITTETSTGELVTQSYTIYYDKNGFPDFTDLNPGPKYVYTPDALKPPGPSLIGGKKKDGSGKDIKEANLKMEEKFKNKPTKFKWDGKSQKFKIKDPANSLADHDGWVEYTWHHHQDGKTLFPVPTKIHNGFPHTGGSKILALGLEGKLFDSPKL